MPTLVRLLREMVERGAESLHLAPASPPMIRVDGDLVPLDYVPLIMADVPGLLKEVPPSTSSGDRDFEDDRSYETYETISTEANSWSWEKYLLEGEAPTTKTSRSWKADLIEKGFATRYFRLRGLATFSFQVFTARGALSAVFKRIPDEIMEFRELGVPAILEKLAGRPGLYLVGGPPRSGRSSLITTIVDKVNRETPSRILIFESELGYFHSHKRSTVSQVELGADVGSLDDAMRVALGGDFDTFVFDGRLGREERELALRLALRGHAVISSADGRSCSGLLQGFLAEFPPHEQPAARSRLATGLSVVVALQLLPKGWKGRACACEVLPMTPAVRELILKNQLAGIDKLLRASESGKKPATEAGFQSMNSSLCALALKRVVSIDEAREASPDPEGLQALFDSQSVPVPGVPGERRP